MLTLPPQEKPGVLHVDGASVGPYQIVRKLGSGGMGEVYLAQDARLDRQVALKSLSGVWLESADARERLFHEARAAARLNHPNIAAIHDVIETGNRAHIVMEYVPGETLAARITRERLPVEQAVDVSIQLADALAHAHAEGVLHRDLKPANIHLVGDRVIKVLDFGLAKTRRRVGPDPGTMSGEPSVTVAAQIAGTPSYMPPEQLFGHEGDQRGDIYSAGVVLYELLTGRRPFQGADVMALGLAIATGRATPPSDINPAVPAELDRIALKAIARDPADRYESATALNAALREFAASRAEARPAPAPPVLRTVGARRWFAVAAATIACVSLVVAAWLFAGRRNGPAAPGVSIGPAVAVLPFANLSGDAGNRGLGTGMAEVLTASLGPVQGLSVIPRSREAEDRAVREDIGAIARQLGASLLVTGAVQQSGPRLLVTVNLVQATPQRMLWSKSYEDSTDNFFALQRGVAEDLVVALQKHGALRSTVAPDQLATLTDAPTKSRDAFEQYSQARAFVDRQDVPDNVSRAILLLEAAVQTDPDFALAYAALGEAYWTEYEITRERAWTVKARDAVLEAVRRRPDDSEVTLSLALIYRGTGRTDQALAAARRAATLQPGNDRALCMLGKILAENGDMAAAREAFSRAIRIRPGYWGNYSALGRASYAAGQYDEAVKAFTRVTVLQPDHPWGFQMLGTAYHASGNPSGALRYYQEAIKRGPSASAYANMGMIHYDQAQYADAARVYEEALKLSPSSAVTYRNLGDSYKRAGNAARARGAFLKAVELATNDLQINPNDAQKLGLRAVCQAKLGRSVEAQKDAAAALALNAKDAKVLYYNAVTYALGGQTQDALAALKRALAEGYSRSEAGKDDDLRSVRNTPEYRSLMLPIRS